MAAHRRRKTDAKNPFSWMTILGLAFVAMKVSGVVDWSWWIVTMPFWIFTALWISVKILTFAFAVIYILIRSLNKK